MWIFTTSGFLSITEHQYNTSYFTVFAQRKKHIKELFPDATIHRPNFSDFYWCADVLKAEAISTISKALSEVSYCNFNEEAIKDPDFSQVYIDFLYDLQGCLGMKYTANLSDAEMDQFKKAFNSPAVRVPGHLNDKSGIDDAALAAYTDLIIDMIDHNIRHGGPRFLRSRHGELYDLILNTFA